MKICVISTPVFALGNNGLSGYGGLEQVAWQQATGLASRGHEVTLVAPDGSVCPGASILPVGPERRVNEVMAFEKYKAHLNNYEVILDHSWEKWTYTLKQVRQLRPPVLGWMHAPVNTMYQTLPAGVDRPSFVCISKDQAAHFEALHGRPARVCYNAVDSDYYKPTGLPRSDRFLFLARFSAIKGADLAIEACRKAGVGLDLVGDITITHEPEFFARCQSMCDGTQIRMVGPATRSECVHWFSRARCLLHPNQRFREPFGLAPVEALACGCPVIAWNYGAMRETMPHHDGGGPAWLVNSLDEMVAIIRNINTPDVPSGEGSALLRRWAQKFSVSAMIDRCEELCREALETGGW